MVSVSPHSPGNCQILELWGGGRQEVGSKIHFSLNDWVLSLPLFTEAFVMMPKTRAALAFLHIAKALRGLLPLEFIVGLCRPCWSTVVQSQLTETSASQVQEILLRQPPK